MKLIILILIASCIADIIGPMYLLIKNKITLKEAKKAPKNAVKVAVSILLNFLALIVFIDYLGR